MKLLTALLIVGLSAAAPAAAADQPRLDLVEFFTGRTRAESQIKVAFRRPVKHEADSVGKRAANGDLVLVDTIKEEGKPTKVRRWQMRRAGPNKFTGTLTDALGPVTVTVDGNEARIRYKMKGGVSIDQHLTMRDSKTLTNHVTAKKLGVRVGRLEGVIRKVD